MVIFGSNIWHHAKFFKPKKSSKSHATLVKPKELAEEVQGYKTDLNIWVRNMTNQLRRWNTSIPMIFALQDLVWPRYEGPGRVRGNNQLAEIFNKAAVEVLQSTHPHVLIWHTGRTLIEYLYIHSNTDVMEDDIHLNEDTYMVQVQLLLNYLFILIDNCRRQSKEFSLPESEVYYTNDK